MSCHALYGAGRLPSSDPVGFPLETRSNSERRRVMDDYSRHIDWSFWALWHILQSGPCPWIVPWQYKKVAARPGKFSGYMS